MDLIGLAERVVPILVFLVGMTVLAELSDRIGLFGRIADLAARLGRGSVLALWLLITAAAVLITAVLSLDTTAVLVTPVAVALARRVGADRLLFAYTTVWLANTASLFLPSSNLTNLLAMQRLELTARGFAAFTWPVATALVLATVALLMNMFRRSLRGRYDLPPRHRIPDRPLLVLAFLVCVAIGPAIVAGAPVYAVAVAGAAVLLIATIVRRRELVLAALRSGHLVPWRLLIGVTVLFLLVQLAHDHGLPALLSQLSGAGHGWPELTRLTVLGAVAANLINNLPAYLALEPVADSLARTTALLIGVNAGPLITPWASLATLLWAGRCRAAGVRISWRDFALRGLLLVSVLLLVGVGLLSLQTG
ncbi:SLC13 family permease [Microlunatus speluncae]|uniref:SLC13 family permease n=1 Tax=Microlunatus speluncae TaxID=2594267 RepID=UPI001C2D6C3A|nr:SLC13 family permease [Microlunatus speluncae]